MFNKIIKTALFFVLITPLFLIAEDISNWQEKAKSEVRLEGYVYEKSEMELSSEVGDNITIIKATSNKKEEIDQTIYINKFYCNFARGCSIKITSQNNFKLKGYNKNGQEIEIRYEIIYNGKTIDSNSDGILFTIFNPEKAQTEEDLPDREIKIRAIEDGPEVTIYQDMLWVTIIAN